MMLSVGPCAQQLLQVLAKCCLPSHLNSSKKNKMINLITQFTFFQFHFDQTQSKQFQWLLVATNSWYSFTCSKTKLFKSAALLNNIFWLPWIE